MRKKKGRSEKASEDFQQFLEMVSGVLGAPSAPCNETAHGRVSVLSTLFWVTPPPGAPSIFSALFFFICIFYYLLKSDESMESRPCGAADTALGGRLTRRKTIFKTLASLPFFFGVVAAAGGSPQRSK